MSAEVVKPAEEFHQFSCYELKSLTMKRTTKMRRTKERKMMTMKAGVEVAVG